MSTSPRTRTAVLAAVAALGLAALAGCGEDDPRAEDRAPADSSTSETPGTSDASASPGASESSAAPDQKTTVPVYFVGDTPQGPRLFREFRQVSGAEPLEAAAALMASGEALDPDYRTAYPDGSFESIEHTDSGFRVTLPDDSWTTPAGMDASEEAPLAVQQLVYTLQGVQQERVPVEVFVGDQPTTLFGVDTAGGLSEGDPIETLALVNVTSPEEGAAVSGSFAASGVASSFEATVPWELRDASGAVVKEGFATAEGWMDKLYPWETEVDLAGVAPGEYTFAAMTSDPSGGEEGSGPTEDTKAITVE